MTETLQKLRCAEIHQRPGQYEKQGFNSLREFTQAFSSSSDHKMDRIHLENKNPNGRILKESAVHNNVTHECNRHRLNGYKDKTWIDRVPNEHIFDYERKRNFDQNRKQNITNVRFPSLAEARDQYLQQEQQTSFNPENGESETDRLTNSEAYSKKFIFNTQGGAKNSSLLEKNDNFIDPNLLTQDQKANLYLTNQSPRTKATNSLIANATGSLDVNRTIDAVSRFNGKRRILESTAGEYSKQTLTSSVKTREIIKHKYGMNFPPNMKFVPVSKTQAKDQIFRNAIHDTQAGEIPGDEFDNKISNISGSQFKQRSIVLTQTSPRERNLSEEHSKMVQGLSDPLFASKLEKMEQRHENISKLSLGKQSYTNDYVSAQKNKTALYDYQKIQSTQHGSQFLGQRHYIFGGPTSGHQSNQVKEVHGDHKSFVRTSPSPNATFDNTRGANPPINSYNNINQFMPNKDENPRLTVLQNFKEINRIMTNTFIKNKQLESKYKSRIPRDVANKKEIEEQAAQNMTRIMKKMHSPRNFTSPLKRFGSTQNYQNVNLAKSIMLETHKMKLKHSFAGGVKMKNMNSFMHSSSQFDNKNMNASTIDGSMNLYDTSMYTNTDAMEQAHNSMNLALGKPTQTFHGKNQSLSIPADGMRNTNFDPLAQDSLYSGHMMDEQKQEQQSV